MESHLCVDLLINLASYFSGSCDNSPLPKFVEISAFDQILNWPRPLPPSEAFAVRQILDLAVATGTLHRDRILSNALWIGHFDLVQSLIASDRSAVEPEIRIERFNTIAHHLEGLLLYVGKDLYGYLEALEQHERACSFMAASKFGEPISSSSSQRICVLVSRPASRAARIPHSAVSAGPLSSVVPRPR